MKAARMYVLIALVHLLALRGSIHAQASGIDYVKLRKTLITRTCGTKSLDEVTTNQAALARIDPVQIRKGLDLFHYDVAMLAYTRAALTGDTAWLAEAIGAFHQAIDANSSFYPAFQGLAVCHYLREDCPSAVEAVNDYSDCAPRKYRDDPQLDDIVKSCAARHPRQPPQP